MTEEGLRQRRDYDRYHSLPTQKSLLARTCNLPHRHLTGTVSCPPSDHGGRDVGVRKSLVPRPALTDAHESHPPAENQRQRLHPVPSPHGLLAAWPVVL